MALTFVCAVCGIKTAGLGGNTKTHWDSQTAGTITLDTGVSMFGTAQTFSCAAAATQPFLGRTMGGAGVNCVTVVCGFQVSSTSPSPVSFPLRFRTATGSMGIKVRSGNFVLEHDGTGNNSTIVAATADTPMAFWVEAHTNSTTWTMKCRYSTDMRRWTDVGDFTIGAMTAGVITNVMWGHFDGPTSSQTVKLGPIAIWEASAQGTDYPATPYPIVFGRYRPASDGTHGAFTTGDMKKDNSVNIASSATDTFNWIDDTDQSSIADFLSQNVASSPRFLTHNFQTESDTTRVPLGVNVTSTFHASGTAACEMNHRVSDDGSTWTNLWGNWGTTGEDVSDTSAHYRSTILTTKPTGGAWTRATLNTMRSQWGLGDDVSPVPFFDSTSLEVIFQIQASLLYLPQHRFRYFRR